MKKTLLHIFIGSVFATILLFGYSNPVYAISLTASIGDQSTEVLGGDRLYFEIQVKYPENPARKDLRVEYQILQDGKLLASEKVLRAVETQASFLDYVVVPKSAKSGIHELNVIVTDYGSMREEISATFTVLKGSDETKQYFFILLGVIILVGALVMIQIAFINRRKGFQLRAT